MIIPNILALDVDGVLCDGVREYGEARRRSYMRGWGHIARCWPWREHGCRYVDMSLTYRRPFVRALSTYSLQCYQQAER
jgi:hypothetical protein